MGVQRCGRFGVLMMAGFEDEQAAGDAAPLVKTNPIIFPAFRVFLAFQECLNSDEKAGGKSVSLCAVTYLQYMEFYFPKCPGEKKKKVF